MSNFSYLTAYPAYALFAPAAVEAVDRTSWKP